MINIFVSSEENNQTVISFIKKRFKSTPLSLIYKLLRTKKIQINKQNCRYYHHRLKTGDEIEINDQKIKPFTLKNELPAKPVLELGIIYEDQNILIAIKGHNIEINRSGDKNCLDNQVRYHIYQNNPVSYQNQVKKFFSINAIHRLDKLTKGLVIYAKDAVAKKILYNSIQDKNKISKSYLAICQSSSDESNLKIPFLMRGFIHKNEVEKRMEFSLEKPNNILMSKLCSLQIQKLFKQKKYYLLKMTLDTGRKHQIRSILSFLKLPVVGDKKYGSKIKLPDKIYLFAYFLEFNNLPPPLNYLNKKSFQIENLEEKLKERIKKESF